MSTVTTTIKMRALTVTRGPIMHLAEPPRCNASITESGALRRSMTDSKDRLSLGFPVRRRSILTEGWPTQSRLS